MITKEDKRLISGLKNGDKKIFEEIYRFYYLPLFKYCFNYIGNEKDAEEIIQTIFLRLWVKRDNLNINISLKAYLYGSTKNESLNYLNHKKIENKYSQHKIETTKQTTDNFQSKYENEELEILIKQAILKLPEKRRKIFEMSRYDGLKYSDIAEKLSVSVKTVETQMTKALKTLRKSLKDYLP